MLGIWCGYKSSGLAKKQKKKGTQATQPTLLYTPIPQFIDYHTLSESETNQTNRLDIIYHEQPKKISCIIQFTINAPLDLTE